MSFIKKTIKTNYTKSQLKKVSYFMIGSFVIIYAILSYFLVFRRLLNKQKSSGNFICHNKICFDIQIAKTKKQKEIGLMGVSKLPSKSGMLFEFDKSGKYPFWMKNTLIPLDIIWMDKKYTILDIQTAQPCNNKKKQIVETDTSIGKKTQEKEFFCPNYIPKKKANFVLEINAGLSEKLGIKVGEKFILNK